MDEEQSGTSELNGVGALAATVTALLVLVAIVALFLLFKFNLFNGGKPGNLPTTAPARHSPVLIV